MKNLGYYSFVPHNVT